MLITGKLSIYKNNFFIEKYDLVSQSRIYVYLITTEKTLKKM